MTEFSIVRDVLLSQWFVLAVLGAVGWMGKRLLDSRKEQKAAKEGRKIATLESLAESIAELRAFSTERFANLETEIERGAAADRVFMHDRLKHIGTRHLSAGAISFDDRKDYYEMYEQYHSLGGNGNITVLYDNIMKLPLKQVGGTQ